MAGARLVLPPGRGVFGVEPPRPPRGLDLAVDELRVSDIVEDHRVGVGVDRGTARRAHRERAHGQDDTPPSEH